MTTEDSRSALPLLLAGAASLDLQLDLQQQELFVGYCDLLQQASAQFNLTAVRSAEGVMRTLFLDSLTLDWAIRGRVGTEAWVVDVGSGAGIPGLPLEILHPEWHMTLIESIGKKARFLQTTAQQLGLPGVNVIAERAEVAGAGPLRDNANLCVARAVASLPTLIELCAPLVAPSGLLVLPRGGDVKAEIAAAGPAARALRATLDDNVAVPAALGLRAERYIVIYRKIGPTPPGYPRRIGLAKSRPIGVSPRSPE